MAIMANSRLPRIIGAVLKSLGTLVVFLACGLVIWRMCSSGDPASVKKMIPNDALCTVYAEKGEDTVFRYQLRNSSEMITGAEYNRGYFAVTECVFIPEANQVQLVLRYNKSTLTHVKEDLNLTDDLLPEDDCFGVRLTVVTDLTPDDAEDNEDPACLSEEAVEPTGEVVRETTKLYCYRRFVFDNVTVTDGTLAVFADIRFLGGEGQEEHDYGSLPLCEAETEWRTYKLSGADRRALKEYIEAK